MRVRINFKYTAITKRLLWIYCCPDYFTGFASLLSLANAPELDRETTKTWLINLMLTSSFLLINSVVVKVFSETFQFYLKTEIWSSV